MYDTKNKQNCYVTAGSVLDKQKGEKNKQTKKKES